MKDKSIDKKKTAPAPIILIQDTQQLSNTIMISKMINNKQNSSIKPSSNIFGGGFKYRPEQNESKNDNSKLLANVSKMDKHTVYDEFGLINDSIGKKKYREEIKQPEKYSQVGQVRVVSSNNPWKKQSQPSNDQKFGDSGYYQISKMKQREQTAIHVKSSLEVINLENIQAKLQAHRSSIRPIQLQYNQLKGKSNIFQEPRQKMRFKDNIDHEFNEIQPTKVYQMIKNTQSKMDRPKEEVTLQQMWDQKKKNDPKIAQYEFKYQQFLVDKEAKKMIGSVIKQNLFSWDKYAKKEEIQKRKQAQRRKSKQRSYGDIIQNKSIQKNNRSLSPEKTNLIENISIRSIEEVLATKDDKFIGKYIMAQIDLDKRGMISKEELYEYIQSKKHIINGYHIDLKWLHTDLDNYQTKRKGMLNQQQIVQFLATLDSLHHPQIVLKQVSSKNQQQQSPILFQNKDKSKPYTSYYPQNMHRFQKVFQMLDFNDDKIIKREEFIENIFIDADCNKILDNNVLVLNVINKNITFRQIISLILDDYRKQRNQKLKKSKQYITLQNFHKYFEVPESLDLNLIDKNSIQKARKQSKSTQIQMFDIQQEYLFILKDIFDTIPRIYQNYIVINDFISISMQDPQILAISDQLCRIQSFQTKIPVQTIRSVLLRMRKQCDQYGTWEIVKTYFSRRGRPLDWDLELIQKKKELREQKFKDKGSRIKNSAIKGEESSQSRPAFQLSGKMNSGKKLSSLQKYTIPKPFNITDQKKKPESIKKIISSQQKEIEEMKKAFKAKPLNSQILAPKPDLIQGKLQKSLQKSSIYNYQNYQNDRIERVLKKAQQKLQEQQRLKQIKRLSEVQAKQVKIDLKKKLQDVVKQQKQRKQKTKPKPTVPQVSPNLYPQNPKQQAQKKIDKFKSKLQKQKQAAAVRDDLKKQIQQRAKERNEQIKTIGEQKKKKQQQQKEAFAKLQENSFKPTINKKNTTQEQKQAMKRAKEQRQQKKLDEQLSIIKNIEQKKKEKLSYIKVENKLQIDSLQDEEILKRIDEVDLQDLLLDQDDKASFRKQFQMKGKTRKQIKERFNGLAVRERGAMQIQEKRLLDERRQAKEKKQAKIVKQKIQQAKELKEEVTTTMNVDTNFHRSNALRRYRAMMEGKQPPSEYDQYSRVGDPEKNQI